MDVVHVHPLPKKLENNLYWYLDVIHRMRRGLSQSQIKRDRSCRDVWHVMRAIYLSEHRRNGEALTATKLRTFIKNKIDPSFCTGRWITRIDLVLCALQSTGVLCEHPSPAGPVLSIVPDEPLLTACVKGLQ